MSESSATETLTLDGCIIVTDPDLPSYVQVRSGGLRGYLQEITGAEPRVTSSLDPSANVAIVVGPQSARQILDADPLAADSDGDGYILKSWRRTENTILLPPGLLRTGRSMPWHD